MTNIVVEVKNLIIQIKSMNTNDKCMMYLRIVLRKSSEGKGKVEMENIEKAKKYGGERL